MTVTFGRWDGIAGEPVGPGSIPGLALSSISVTCSMLGHRLANLYPSVCFDILAFGVQSTVLSTATHLRLYV